MYTIVPDLPKQLFSTWILDSLEGDVFLSSQLLATPRTLINSSPFFNVPQNGVLHPFLLCRRSSAGVTSRGKVKLREESLAVI